MEPTRLRPLQVGEILDAAIKVYRSRFADLVKIVAVMVAPVQVLAVLVEMSVPSDGFTSTDQFGNTTFDGGDFVGTMAAFFAVWVLGGIATQLATAGSIKTISETYLGERRSWTESLRFAIDRFGPLLWLLVIFSFITVVALIPCGVPGIYLYVSWWVAVPALVLEDHRGFKALSRSRHLVKGMWWRVFGLVIITVLLTSVLGFILGLVFGGVVLAADSATVDSIAQGVANFLSSVLVTPITAAVISVLYFDLRVRKEGFDLELLARSVGVDAPIEPERPSWGWDDPPPSV